MVFTVPAEIADIACHNKSVVYDLLFKASAETVAGMALQEVEGLEMPPLEAEVAEHDV